MMANDRLRLFNWLKSDKAMSDYSHWKDNAVTNIIIGGLRKLNEARLISANPIDGKLDPMEAIQINAFRAGRESIINMIEHLDDFIVQNDEGMDIDENHLVQYLMDNERYSKSQAKRMINNDETGVL